MKPFWALIQLSIFLRYHLLMTVALSVVMRVCRLP